jgi:predicted metal-dependent peptidase
MCFYGNLALHLTLKECADIDTFATDGKVILYNPDFAKALDDGKVENTKEKQWVLAHEILHVILSHLSRRGNRDINKWNIAVDYAVNSILNKEFGFVPDGALFDCKYENMSAEQIYSLLPDIKKQNGCFHGVNSDFEISINKKGNVKINGKKVKKYDEHKDIKGTKTEIEDLEKEWKVQTVKAYQQAKMQGKLPAGMDIFIDNFLAPKVDWRTMMKQFIVSTAKSDYRWLPPNRRHLYNDIYLPSLTGECLNDVVVIIDNSGSTVEFQQRFFSECNGLLQQYDMNLHLIVVDVEINSYKVYTKGDVIDKSYKGAGGTDLRVAFDYILEKGINPTVVVCLTDGETPFPENEIYPTLWVISPNGVDFDKIPFGQKVRIVDDEF